MKPLRKLELRAFRGASRPLALEFDPSKSVVLVFGENGTGKTTIADALDAVGNCSPGSLKDRSSTDTKAHLPSLGKAPTDVEIRLEDAVGNSWTTTMSKSRIVTTPPQLPSIRVLRRSDLLKLVDAPPAERYEVLRRFVDVPEIVRSENTLRDAATDAKKRFDDAVKRRSEAERTLDEIWHQDGAPSPSWQEWAKNLANQKTAALEKVANEVRAASDSIITALSALEACRRAKTRVTDEEKKQVEHQQKIANTPAPDTRAAMDTARLLRQAADYLTHRDHSDTCPVCRQQIPIAQLRQDLDTRLSQLERYEALESDRTRIGNDLKGAQDAYERQTAAFAADAIAAHQVLGQPTPAKVPGVTNLVATFPTAAIDWTAETASALSSETLRALAKFIQEAKTVQAQLKDEERRFQQQIGQIKSVATSFSNYQKAVLESRALERQSQRLNRASDIVRETRIAFTDGILVSVAQETNRLYGIIHPNEPVAFSKLELDKAHRASLIQLAHFEGEDNVPPQAYFSESHLDTLAFCFWFAVAKREIPLKDAVLVLDDIFTSVDAQHLNRISQLIINESAHFAHIVLTTHHRRWRDAFRNLQSAGNRAQLIELQRWSLTRGILAYKTQLAVAQLAQSVQSEPFERQRVANEAGILLEAMLDHLALRYRCRVPRTADNAYTLGELLDGTTSLFKQLWLEKPKAARIGGGDAAIAHETITPKEAFNKLKEKAFIRNQVGAHFNLTGLEISDAEVEEFANLTVDLAEALSCTECGQIPGKKGANHYECSCPKPTVVRMLPLQL